MARSRSSASRQAAKAGAPRRPAKLPAGPQPQVPAGPSEATFTGLRRFNAIMGGLHLLQGILMIVLSNATTYPIYTNYLRFDLATMRLTPNPALVYQLRFGPAVAVFLLISAVAHFSLATFGYRWYVANLRRHMNPARFYEYALSSSLMIVLIGMLVGVYDLGSLILMFGINAMMNLFGIMMERHNQTTAKTDWTSFIFGCIAGIIPWVVIVFYLVGAAVQSGAEPPAFVYGIIASLFVLFFSFAVNMYLQYKKVGRWRDYLFGERMFIVLSLVAKTLLAWQIFAGTLAPV
ncbi:MAG: heliorhodopsin HeR [Anaerolineae bacterium]